MDDGIREARKLNYIKYRLSELIKDENVRMSMVIYIKTNYQDVSSIINKLVEYSARYRLPQEAFIDTEQLISMVERNQSFQSLFIPSFAFNQPQPPQPRQVNQKRERPDVIVIDDDDDNIPMVSKYQKVVQVPVERVKLEAPIPSINLLRPDSKAPSVNQRSPTGPQERVKLEAVESSKIKLFEYQVFAVRRILEQRGTCLCYDTGNGKSLVAVTATQQMLLQNPNVQITVIAPLSLLSNFQLSLERYGSTRDHPSYDYYTYEGFAIAYKKDLSLLDGRVVIFDEVHHIRTDVYTTLKAKHKARVKKLKRKRHQGEELTDGELEYIEHGKQVTEHLKQASKMNICDPISYVDEQTGIDILCIAPRSLLAINAVRKSLKVICLTATPFFNSPYDMVPLACMMRGDNVYSKRYFTYLTKSHREFQSKFGDLFLFKDIDKNDKDFPHVKTHKIDLMMTREYYNAYHEIEEEIQSKTKVLNLDNPWYFLFLFIYIMLFFIVFFKGISIGSKKSYHVFGRSS